jgi:hypothetical protein
MRLLGYFCLTAMVCVGSAARLAQAAGDQPIGVVVNSQNGNLDGTAAVAGSDFYGGEEFVTYAQGSMQLRVHHCRIDLGENTDARFLPDETPDHLLVIQGSARYSCPAGAFLLIDTPAGIVHGVEGQPASAMIVITDPRNLVISAYDQGLVLDNDGELHGINAGQTYRVAVEEEADASPASGYPPQVQRKRRRRKIAMWLIGGSVTAFAVTDVIEQMDESPYKPTNTH